MLVTHLPTVGRVGLIFEGFGVDHLHAKLAPMHGTQTDGGWNQITSTHRKTFDHYEGYISSHDGPRASPNTLEAVHRQITTPTDSS